MEIRKTGVVRDGDGMPRWQAADVSRAAARRRRTGDTERADDRIKRIRRARGPADSEYEVRERGSELDARADAENARALELGDVVRRAVHVADAGRPVLDAPVEARLAREDGAMVRHVERLQRRTDDHPAEMEVLRQT